MAWHDAFQLSQQRSHFVPVYLTEFNMRRLHSSHYNLVEDGDEQLLLQSECQGSYGSWKTWKVMENLESHGILEFDFPGLESHGN